MVDEGPLVFPGFLLGWKLRLSQRWRRATMPARPRQDGPACPGMIAGVVRHAEKRKVQHPANKQLFARCGPLAWQGFCPAGRPQVTERYWRRVRTISETALPSKRPAISAVMGFIAKPICFIESLPWSASSSVMIRSTMPAASSSRNAFGR